MFESWNRIACSLDLLGINVCENHAGLGFFALGNNAPPRIHDQAMAPCAPPARMHTALCWGDDPTACFNGARA